MAFSGLGSGTVDDPYQITTVVQLYEMGGSANAGLYYLLINNLNLAENAMILVLYAHFDGGNHIITSPLPFVYGEYLYLYIQFKSGATLLNIVINYEGVDFQRSSNLYYSFSITSASTAIIEIANVAVINHLLYGSLAFRNYTDDSWGNAVIINGLTIDGSWTVANFGSDLYCHVSHMNLLLTNNGISVFATNIYGSLEYFQFYYTCYILDSDSVNTHIFGLLNAGAIIRYGIIKYGSYLSPNAASYRRSILLKDIATQVGTYIFSDILCVINYFQSSYVYQNAVFVLMNQPQSYNGTIVLKNILFEGNIDTPNSSNKNSRNEILDITHKVINSYYNKDKLIGLNDADYTGQIGLTTTQILDSTNFVDWDFVNNWQMTANGPRLREVPEYSFVNVRDYGSFLRNFVKLSATSFSFEIGYSDSGSTFIIDIYDGETLIYTDTRTSAIRSGLYLETLTISELQQIKDTNFKIVISVLINDIKTCLKYYYYYHYYLDSASDIITINCTSLFTLNDGTNSAKYIHGNVLYNGYWYGSARANINYNGTITKISASNPTDYEIFPIIASTGYKIYNMDSLVQIGDFLYSVARMDYPNNVYYNIVVKFSLIDYTYQLYRIGVGPNYGSPGCTDGEYWYVSISRSTSVGLQCFKINPSIFNSSNTEELSALWSLNDSLFIDEVSHYSNLQVHAICVDGIYLYLGFGSGTSKLEYEVQKILKSNLTYVDYATVPKHTDDMTQTDTHLFFGIELLSPAVLETYGYGVGCFAVRKSDMHVTLLPKLHSLESEGNYSNSYASTIVGNYLIDCRINKYIAVIDISDVDDWLITESVGQRTLKYYKLMKTDGLSQISYPVNEISYISDGCFFGFLWYSTSSFASFTLTGLVFTAEPTINSISATVYDITWVDFQGYIVNTGGYSVSECGFFIGQQPDLSDGVSYACDDIEINFHKTVIMTENGTFYWQAYAVNEAGTGYGEINDFEIILPDPVFTTNSVTDITSISATCGGAISNYNGNTILAAGVCWSTSTSPTLVDSHTIDEIIADVFTSYLTELSALETYYVRSYLTISSGTIYGDQKTFQATSDTPTTQSVSAIALSSILALFNGLVTDNGGETVTECGFNVGQQSDLSDGVAHACLTVQDEFSLNINMPGTGLYYWQSYAKNINGTGYGDIESFDINATDPVLATNTVTSITVNSAVTGGVITDDNGHTILTAGVCYSTSTSPTTAGSHTTDTVVDGAFTSNLSSLVSAETYYVRAYVTTSEGTYYGDEKSFATITADVPIPQSEASVVLNQTTAILSGTISSTGGYTVTECGFIVGVESNLSDGITHACNLVETDFSLEITFPGPGTYYWKAYSVNEIGTGYSEIRSFTIISQIDYSGGSGIINFPIQDSLSSKKLLVSSGIYALNSEAIISGILDTGGLYQIGKIGIGSNFTGSGAISNTPGIVFKANSVTPTWGDGSILRKVNTRALSKPNGQIWDISDVVLTHGLRGSNSYYQFFGYESIICSQTLSVSTADFSIQIRVRFSNILDVGKYIFDWESGGVGIALVQNADHLSLVFDDGATDSSATFTNYTIQVGSPVTVMLNFDRSGLAYLYVNSILLSTISISGSSGSLDNASYFTIGNSVDVNAGFMGDVYSLIIWNYLLEQTDIYHYSISFFHPLYVDEVASGERILVYLNAEGMFNGLWYDQLRNISFLSSSFPILNKDYYNLMGFKTSGMGYVSMVVGDLPVMSGTITASFNFYVGSITAAVLVDFGSLTISMSSSGIISITSNSATTISSASSIETNSWITIRCIRLSNGYTKLFINSELSVVGSTGTPGTLTELKLGNGLYGVMDDFRVCNGAIDLI